jgi:hypothetical protein
MVRIAGVDGQAFALLAEEPFGSPMFEFMSAFSGTIAGGTNEIQRGAWSGHAADLTASTISDQFTRTEDLGRLSSGLRRSPAVDAGNPRLCGGCSKRQRCHDHAAGR